MNKNPPIACLFFLAVILFVFARSGQAKSEVSVCDSGYFEVMGTIAHIVSVGFDNTTAERSVTAAKAALKNVERSMSGHDPNSLLSRINRNAFKEPVRIDSHMQEVFIASRHYSELTKGVFDITVGPIVDLWNKAEENSRKPTDKEIAKATSKVGHEKLLIDKENQTIRFQMDGMRIDLGGIAKGYGIDRAVEALTDRGAVGGLVDVGGDIFCFGMNRNGEKGWKIGIKEPVNPGGVLVVLNIDQAAVATSGDYRRFVIIDGERYSHIVNPDTGISATGTPSVTIISRTAIQADALATAVSVMGYKKGIRLLGTIEDTEAVILVPLEEGGLEKIYTEGMDKYIDTSYSEQ